MSLLLLLKNGEGGEEPTPEVAFNPDYRPSLSLGVELETAEGVITRLSPDDLKAANVPTGITFSTQRGDGFGTASFTLTRDILKDHPDLNLLDTVRFIGEQGEIAYEGRIHSMPRTNEPTGIISISCVGWMTYLKSKPCAALIIDRRLGSWGDMSMQRKGQLLTESFVINVETGSGWQDSGTKGPGISFRHTQGITSFQEIGEAWSHAGGEAIGALRYDFDVLDSNGEDSAFTTRGILSDDDQHSNTDVGTDCNQKDAANQEVTATGGRYYATLQDVYTGSATGDLTNSHAFLHPRIIGTHGLTARGTSPEEGYYITDIMKHVASTYYPKIDTSEVQENTFAVQQFTKHDSPSDGHAIFTELNDYALWELGVWEERKLHYGPADLSKYDWVLRTDDPGVTVNWQGDSIENFANGIVVTYSDFWGITRTLYPDDYSELRDPSEDNPASRHGEDLWTSVTVPWRCLEAEALQFGRAYLGEFNRPRRPGSYRVHGGYLRDGAGHWRQGWQARNSQTLGILDHPQDFPRLIFSTSWTQDGTAIDIQVDGLPSTLDAVVARHQLALASRNLG